MKITYQGREWKLDMSDVDVRDMIEIQGHTGLTFRQWSKALVSDADDDGNVTAVMTDKPGFLLALVGVHWLMLRQNGEDVPISQVRFKVGEFGAAYYAAVAAENEALTAAQAAKTEPEPEDPTRPAGDSAPSPEPTTPRPSKRRAAPPGSRDG